MTEKTKSLKIAVNTRLLLKDKLEGIGWFTFETLKRITVNHPEHEFYFLFDREYDESFIFSENITPIVIGPQARHPLLFKLWFNHSISRILKRIKADVFLSPDGFLSLKTNVPQIVVIHDLNFEHFPEDLPKHITKYYKKFVPKFTHKATRIITVSEFSKKDIVEQYHVSENKIDVVYNGVGDIFCPSSTEQIEIAEQKYSEGMPYFVYVGSLHGRKNIERMLLAFDQFKTTTNSNYKMVIVGEKIWKNVSFDSAISNLKHREDIVFTGRITPKNLNTIIGSSKGLVYVSYFEGFGIPILEGMKCGVPVITSNVTSMPEVANSAAILVDPFSVDSIAEGMQLLLDKKTSEKYKELGLERVSNFSWDNTAEGVWNTIKKVVKLP